MSKKTKRGGWAIVKTLTRGGQAEVYLVRREGDPNQYVLKEFPAKHREGRGLREAQVLGSLEHVGIARFVDSGRYEERIFVVTAYYELGSLHDNWPSISRMGLDEKLLRFRGLCEAIALAHSHGCVHRDLKPANIFVGADGQWVIGDFGLCYIDEPGDRLTAPFEVAGPRHFMAPELEDGRLDEVKPSLDVYSLGKLWYWILSGRSFSREKHRSEFDLNYRPGSEEAAAYDILDRMLVEPQSRMRDASEVVRAIDHAMLVISAIRKRIRIGEATIGVVSVPENGPASVVSAKRPEWRVLSGAVDAKGNAMLYGIGWHNSLRLGGGDELSEPKGWPRPGGKVFGIAQVDHRLFQLDDQGDGAVAISSGRQSEAEDLEIWTVRARALARPVLGLAVRKLRSVWLSASIAGVVAAVCDRAGATLHWRGADGKRSFVKVAPSNLPCPVALTADGVIAGACVIGDVRRPRTDDRLLRTFHWRPGQAAHIDHIDSSRRLGGHLPGQIAVAAAGDGELVVACAGHLKDCGIRLHFCRDDQVQSRDVCLRAICSRFQVAESSIPGSIRSIVVDEDGVLHVVLSGDLQVIYLRLLANGTVERAEVIERAELLGTDLHEGVARLIVGS